MKRLFSLLLLSYLAVHTFAQDKLPKGTKVNILEIDNEDTYYAERVDFLGKEAIALGELTKNSNGFYSGTLELNSGRTCFFRFVKVAKLDAPKSSTTSPKAVTTTNSKAQLFTGTIPKGTPFKILEVPSDDSYYKDRAEIEGKTGVTKETLTVNSDGYVGGNITTSDGKSYYFYKVKLGKNGNASTSTTTKPITFVTGTLKSGTTLYLAEISPDDSYYSDRFEKVGKKGKVSNGDLTMKDDGYYAGDFTYDDGSTAYFYKAKFSKEPVSKLLQTETTKTETTKKETDDDYSDLAYLFGGFDMDEVDVDWDKVTNDKNIKKGDKVEVTAVDKDDSYYSERDEYIGKKGIAGDDLDYDANKNGYGGTVKLDDGNSPYFFLVKLKKVVNNSNSNRSTSSNSNLPSTIAKNTKVKVVDLGTEDSFYNNKNTYIGKTGKVADGLNLQDGVYYSGKILFDDGTDAYFFNAKIAIVK